jgi:hypothetical protein
MDPQPSNPASELITQETAFVYKYFEAAELDARTTERHILIALGAIYSYLSAKAASLEVPGWAWYAPTLVVLFAGIRAAGLAWRQRQLLDFLAKTESAFLSSDGYPGWAQWYNAQKPLIAVTAAVFYVLLVGVTLAIAVIMS